MTLDHAAQNSPCPFSLSDILKGNKVALLRLVNQIRPAKTYAVVEIAHGMGHRVLFTPPYHPELQPIEIVWGALKNSLTKNRSWNSMSELISVIESTKANLPSTVWAGARRKVEAY